MAVLSVRIDSIVMNQLLEAITVTGDPDCVGVATCFVIEIVQVPLFRDLTSFATVLLISLTVPGLCPLLVLV